MKVILFGIFIIGILNTFVILFYDAIWYLSMIIFWGILRFFSSFWIIKSDYIMFNFKIIIENYLFYRLKISYL